MLLLCTELVLSYRYTSLLVGAISVGEFNFIFLNLVVDNMWIYSFAIHKSSFVSISMLVWTCDWIKFLEYLLLQLNQVLSQHIYVSYA